MRLHALVLPCGCGIPALDQAAHRGLHSSTSKTGDAGGMLLLWCTHGIADLRQS